MRRSTRRWPKPARKRSASSAAASSTPSTRRSSSACPAGSTRARTAGTRPKGAASAARRCRSRAAPSLARRSTTCSPAAEWPRWSTRQPVDGESRARGRMERPTATHPVEEPAAPAGSAWPTIDLFRTAESAPAVEAAGARPRRSPRSCRSGGRCPSGPVGRGRRWMQCRSRREPPMLRPERRQRALRFLDASRSPASQPLPEPSNGHGPAAPAARAEPRRAGPAEPPSTEPVAAVEAAVGAARPRRAGSEAEPAALRAVGDQAQPSIEPQSLDAARARRARGRRTGRRRGEPVEAQPPNVDPAAEARAMELAERTTRLLGRLRVQPRSAGSAPAPTTCRRPSPRGQPLPRPPAAPQPPEPPHRDRQPPGRGSSRRPTPSTGPAGGGARPEPVDRASADPFDKLVERPAPPAWMQPAARRHPVEPAPEPVEAVRREPARADAAAAARRGADRARRSRAPPNRVLPAAATVARSCCARVRPRIASRCPPGRASSGRRSATRRPVQAPPAPMPAQAPQWPAPAPARLRRQLHAVLGVGRERPGRRELDVWTRVRPRGRRRRPARSPASSRASSCGLSLSATARFCRRCGSRQG